MDEQSVIFISGDHGLKARAIAEHFGSLGYRRLLTSRSTGLDILSCEAVDDLFKEYHPDYVIISPLAPEEPSGVDDRPAEYFLMNMLGQAHVIDAAYRHGSKKLLYLADGDVYPRQCPQPMREEYIAAGPLCPYNRANAIVQAAGIAMCQVYRQQYQFNAVVAVSSMVYGPLSEEDEGRQGSLPEMIDLFVEAVAERAKKVRIVQNPDVRREFLFSADLAEACEFLLRHYDGKEPVNIGSGVDVSIRDLAEMIKDISGFEGTIEYDARKHDEDFQRLLDVTSLHTMGWMPRPSYGKALCACGRRHIRKDC